MSNYLKLIFFILIFFNINIIPEEVKNNNISCTIKEPSVSAGLIETISNTISNIIIQIKEYTYHLFSSTGSFWIRILASFLLGILLSLTPCIYPMIPITIGILHKDQNNKKIKSFLSAFSYTLGISLTFAILGLVAVLGSCAFGQIQSSPFTVIPISLLLIYFGLSMFDFYEIKIPKFLKPKNINIRHGSYLSAFIFGTISGTVASPCLSPGLLLILDYVYNLSLDAISIFNYLEGFILLFIFGIGSSFPLLIIGTFSNSLNMMPRAGAWMLEVKKIIGIMLISMAFYHLFSITKYIPYIIIIPIIIIFFIFLSIYYWLNIKNTDSKYLKIYKKFISLLILFITVIFAIYSYRNYKSSQISLNIWLNNFNLAKEQAQKTGKLIFIDLGSSFCAACKSIDKKFFDHPEIIKILVDKYVPLKVNYDSDEDLYNIINNLYGPIKGFPTYIIVDSKDKIIKKFGAELADLNLSQVAELFLNI